MTETESMILLPTERELILKLSETNVPILLSNRMYKEDLVKRAEKYDINTRTGDETGLLKAFIDGYSSQQIMDKLNSEDGRLPIFRRVISEGKTELRYEVMPSEYTRNNFSSYKQVINDLIKQREKCVLSELITIDKIGNNGLKKLEEIDYFINFAFGSTTSEGFGENSNLNFDGYVFQISSCLPSKESIKKLPSKIVNLQKKLDKLNMQPYKPNLAAEMSLRIVQAIREYTN